MGAWKESRGLGLKVAPCIQLAEIHVGSYAGRRALADVKPVFLQRFISIELWEIHCLKNG